MGDMPAPDDIKPGDWVQVFGQAEPDGIRCRPEDIPVVFRSYNSEWVGTVMRDRVRKIDPPVGIAVRCTAMLRTGPETYVRCELHHHHANNHRQGRENTWADTSTTGFIEEC